LGKEVDTAQWLLFRAMDWHQEIQLLL